VERWALVTTWVAATSQKLHGCRSSNLGLLDLATSLMATQSLVCLAWLSFDAVPLVVLTAVATGVAGRFLAGDKESGALDSEHCARTRLRVCYFLTLCFAVVVLPENQLGAL